MNIKGMQVRTILFNDTGNTLYIQLYGVERMVTKHSITGEETRYCHYMGYLID